MFLLFVLLPALAVGGWTFGFMADQYESEFRYVVRRVAPAAASAPTAGSMLGGVPQLAALSDAQVLVQYTRSRAALDDVAAKVDLQAVFGAQAADWLSRLPPDLPLEDRLRHWRRFVGAAVDMNSSVVTVTVRAFDPVDSQRVADALLQASERLVNDMSRRAQSDALAFANADVDRSAAALDAARRRLADFRNANELISPQMQATIQAGVMSRLREALAEARASYAAQRDGGLQTNAPQSRLMRNRITALEEEIAAERRQLASESPGGSARSLASLLNDYTALESDEKIAAATHERALALQARARAEAMAQGVYLNTFIRPTVAESSTFPRRWWLIGQTLIAGFAVWAIVMLTWRTIQDQNH